MQLYALLTLGFPSAIILRIFTLLHTLTRRTVLQKVPHRTQGALCACKHKVSGSFHSPPGVLFTFPSQYCSTIGHQVVFRLGGWSPHLPCGFHVPAGTLEMNRYCPHFAYETFTLSDVAFQLLRLCFISLVFIPKPRLYCYRRFGLFQFRSPLLSESRLISLPPLT